MAASRLVFCSNNHITKEELARARNMAEAALQYYPHKCLPSGQEQSPASTGPKVRFPLCCAYQNLSFPTRLAEDRAEFL